VFLQSSHQLSKYIDKENLYEKYKNLNTENEGILLEKPEGQITYSLVAGKQRPDMACTNLFNRVYMGRPYTNEVLEAWETEQMSFEEKIALAEDGDTEKMRDVSLAYLLGDGGKVERDYQKALDWMKKMEENGDSAWSPLRIECQSVVDHMEAANAGDSVAQTAIAENLMKMGLMITDGEEESDNLYKESVKYAEKASKQNNARAFWDLGLAYSHGRGVDADGEMAVKMYERGAELGGAECQHNLGFEYLQGNFVAKDSKKGFELIRKAAEQGYDLAVRDLGKCYDFGWGVEKDVKKAIEWYEKAIELLDDPEDLPFTVEMLKEFNL
jgi:TPR repeat protein